MSFFYALLAVIGWIWLVITGVFLFVRMRKSSVRGFEVQAVPSDEKQH